MPSKKILKAIHDLAEPFRVTKGSEFRLKDIDPGDTLWMKDDDKKAAEEVLEEGVEALAELQEMLYAQDQWALLCIFQAMDAAGKDGAIKHVMSGVNPQGCQVFAFKAPSSEDLDHDFMWRCAKSMPERGRIGIFNRSYYEDTLVVRVRPELLEKQKVPKRLVDDDIWEERYEYIRAYERFHARNGTAIVKFYLHLSKKEQKRRFLARLDDPEKHWKFSVNDAAERKRWDDYMDAYEAMIRGTATKHAPWYVVPADHKWFTRLVVAAAIIDTLVSLELSFPKVSKAQRAELEKVRAELAGD